MALVGFDALDWFLRTYVPLWLDAIGARGAATTLRTAKPIADEVAFTTARTTALGAITTAWAGGKAVAGPKFPDAAAYFEGKGVATRIGFDVLDKAVADAKVARDPLAPPAALHAWRRACLLVLASGGTEAMDALGAALDAEIAKVRLG